MMLPGEVVQIVDETDPMRSDLTLLVTALLTLGIAQAGPFHITNELVRGERLFRSTWTLAAESKDKRYATVRMQKAWTDGTWLLANAKHPLAVLREGLTFEKALKHSPKYTLEELTRIEQPETWLEMGMRNLIVLLREMPRANIEGIVRFGPRHAAMVPQTLAEADKTRLLKYVESPAKRHQFRTHAVS